LGNVVDTMQLYETVGFWGTIAVTAILVIIWIAYKNVSRRLSNAEQFMTKLDGAVDLISKSLVTDQGDVVSQAKQQETLNYLVELLASLRDEFAESYTKHIEDVGRLASQDKYRDCDISKCVHLSKIIWAIERISERITAFEDRAQESRTDAANSLDKLRAQLTAISKDLLATLRIFAAGGGKK
jgi:hypothetical protein